MNYSNHSHEEKELTPQNSKYSDASLNESAAGGKPNLFIGLAFTFMLSCGGFIFGYDTGTISGFLKMPSFLNNFGAINANGEAYFPVIRSGIIVSIFSIGALFGCLSSSKAADTFGRIKTIIAFDIIYTIAIVIQLAASNSWVQIMMGRFASGFSVGGFCVVVPMLISESVPSNLRGPSVSFFQVMVTAGILVGNVLCFAFKSNGESLGYRVPLGVSLIFSSILLVAMFIMPESPRYLVSIGEVQKAHESFGKTVCLAPDSAHVTRAIAEITHSVDADKSAGTASWAELVTGKPRILYRVAIGTLMLSIQQLCGANYFFYYGTSLFTSIGTSDSFATSIIFSGVNCACSFIGIYLVSKLSRRFVLMMGSIIMLLSFLIFASLGSFLLNMQVGQEVIVNPIIGKTMIFFACIFIFGFGATWAPLGFVVVSEIFPQRIRSKAMSIASCALWLWNFLISFFTPMITAKIGYKYGYVFSGCILFSVLFVFFCVHETKGISLEEINDMYASGVSAIHSSLYVRKKLTKKQSGEHQT